MIINKRIQNCSLNIEMLFLPVGFGFLILFYAFQTRLTRDLNGNESVMEKNKESKREIDVA